MEHRATGFGPLLQRYRLNAGLTQEELAERAQMSPRGISDLERGVNRGPRSLTLQQLSEALALSAEQRTEFEAAARAARAADQEGGSGVAIGGSQVRTFLIADIRGYTRYTVAEGDEAAARLTSRFRSIVQAVVSSNDGELLEIRGDEVTVVFASPRQALLAASELQDQLSQASEAGELPATVGIGLDAGEAVPVDLGFRGKALNLAARLCALAGPGEVLASQGLLHLAGTTPGISYEDRGLVELKGFPQPINVACVTRETAIGESEPRETERSTRPRPTAGFLGALPPTAMVAREMELARIVDRLGDVAVGEGNCVLISGEPGVGKTRLAQEIMLAASTSSFLVFTGRCYDPQRAVPFFPLREALAQAYNLVSPEVRAQVAARWASLSHLLPDHPIPTAPAAPTNHEEQQRLFAAVTAFIRAASAEAPVALLLDDLHWSDASTVYLLAHLARQTRADRVLILGTFRDTDVDQTHPLHDALLDLTRERLLERVRLEPLTAEGVGSLVKSVLGSGEVGPEVTQVIHARSEGNPLFAAEVVRELYERNFLVCQHGEWRLTAEAAVAVPETVRMLIEQRLLRLSRETQEILTQASVLGQTFEFADLQACLSRPEDELDRALDEATAGDLIKPGAPDLFSFNHSLTQQALYLSLSPRKQRQLHLAATAAILGRDDQAPQRRAAELAWHFGAAGVPEETVRFSLLAGDQAEAVWNHHDAAVHYHTALQMALRTDDTTAEAGVRDKLGGLLTATLRYDEALAMLESAARLYEQIGDFGSQVAVIAQIGRVHNAAGSITTGLDRLRGALGSTEGVAPEILAGLRSALARLEFSADEYAEAEREARVALEVSGDSASGVTAEAAVTLAASLTQLGRWREGKDHVLQAISLAQSGGDVFSSCRGEQHLAAVSLARGEFSRSASQLERALFLARQMGNQRQEVNATIGLALLGFITSEPDAAPSAHEALRTMFELGGFWFPILLTSSLSLWLSDAQWSAMPEELRRCLKVSEDREALARARSQKFETERDLAAGNHASAKRTVAALLRRPDVPHEQKWAVECLMADVDVAADNYSGAARRLAHGIELAQKEQLGLRIFEWKRVAVKLAVRQGRRDEAETLQSESVELARRMPYPLGETMILDAVEI